MSIKDLFCTPEQGRRLKELVPELTSQLVWFSNDNGESYYHEPYFENELDGAYDEGTVTSPALTLQELRDVATNWYWDTEVNNVHLFNNIVDAAFIMTAPKLAAWVIERLEEVER